MENLVHRAVEPGVDRCDRHVLFDQPREFGLVGPLFLQRRPGNLRIHEKGRAWTGGAEHERRRGVRGCVRIEHVVAVTNIDFGFEMRRLEMIVADLEHWFDAAPDSPASSGTDKPGPGMPYGRR